MSDTLKFVIPNGSLAERLLMFLALAGYLLTKPDRRGYCGTSNGVEFYQFDRRMVPAFLMLPFDAGITGKDLLLASNLRADALREICSLCFARSSDRPTRWVLAKRKGTNPEASDQYAEVKIACELPALAEKLLAPLQFPFRTEIVKIEGSEEQYARCCGLVDMVLVVTESGDSLRANDLEIVPGGECLLESTPVILAKQWLTAEKETKLQELRLALECVINARDRIMLTCDLPAATDMATLALPSAVAPTLSPLADPRWISCETCIPRSQLGSVLAQLKNVGARAIAMCETSGFLP